MGAIDDGTIEDEWGLLRRIHPSQIVPDSNTGAPRISSAAFRDPQLSVDAEQLLIRNGHDWKFCLLAHAGYSLARLLAGDARKQNQAVIYDPIVGNDAHTIVKGSKPRSVAKALADSSVWVYRI